MSKVFTQSPANCVHEAAIQALVFLHRQRQPVPVPSDCHARQRDKRLWRNLWWRIIKQQERRAIEQALQHRYPNPLDASEAQRLKCQEALYGNSEQQNAKLQANNSERKKQKNHNSLG